MGNSESCIDCPKKVPKSVKALDKWTKVEDNQYLCQDCLCKRSERVRQEEEQQREEQYRIEAQQQREREYQIEQLREQRQLVEQQQLEEQRQLVEQQQLEEQRQLVEQQQLEEQRQLVEQQRLLVVEQSRLKEQQQLEEQRRVEEQQRLEKQRQLVEQQRLEEQCRLAQHHRLEEQRRFVQQQRLEEQHLEQQRRSEQQSLIGKNQNRLIVPGEQQLQVEENQCTQSNNYLNEEIRQYETQRQLQNQQHFVNYQWLAQLHPLDIQQQLLRQYMNCENQALQQRFNNIQVTIQALSNWKTQITERRKRIMQLRLEIEYEQAEIEAKHQQQLQMVQMRKREDEVRQAEAKRLLERQQQIIEIKRKEEQAEIEAIHKNKLQLVQMRKREEEIRQAEAKRLLEKQEQICERKRKEQEITQRVLERQRELRHADHIVLNQPKIIQTTDKIPVKFLSIRDNTQITLRSAIEPFHILFTKLIGKPEKSDELLFMLNRESIFTKDITSSNQQHPNHERFNCPELFDISVNTILRCMTFVERQFGVQFEPYLIHDHMKLKVIPRKFLNKTSRPFPILILGKGLVCALYKEEKFLCELIARKLKTLIFHQDFKSAAYSIPIHLSQFVQSRLTHWIENAFIAKYMKVGREYLIKDDDIVPIDFESTGVLEIDTKWGDCLHQF
ncbi:unnamed protein product [Mytilus edulis]|uniref:Uncharacterized protein n=1 Tax=Mytilus edulis TaxID=6550 RepID=A0A8S3RRZ6_MYTED|nr:unnamed protein product [Mytilus edulis]